jgi:putative FmdB family regulatory protein
MPIYEYDCQTCGARFDKLVFSPARQNPIRCPECDSEDVGKRLSLISAASGGSREAGTSSAACTTST